MMPRLVVQELKTVYNFSSGWPVWARHLLLGLLVAIQELWIEKKVKQAVDDAVAEVEKHLPPSGVTPPVYSESGDGFFDEMRLSAPWKALEDPSDSPQV
jgi:hypothetical protein